MRKGLGLIIAGVLLACLAPARPAAAEAGDTVSWSGVWNGADLTVTVVARGHDIPDDARASKPWWQWGNTSTDAYVFYWSADQFIDLVLDFSLVDGHPEARLFVPTTREQQVGIQVSDGAYTLPAGLLPALTLRPRGGDWWIDGKPTFNLDGNELDPTTGQMMWEWRIGGAQPGVADWSIREVIPGVDPDTGSPHFQASMRMDPSAPFELATPVMPSWPYLSAIQKEDHFGKLQPIFFNPSSRSIIQNWTGFHIAGMYQINSLNYPPYVNFEAPFAFYRFDATTDRHANLVIRSDIWPRHVEYDPAYETAVRMTWTADAGDLWRYSLTVAGNHEPGQQVTLGDTVVNAVSYADYPLWVTSNVWKAATFVEATEGETGSEGIYDYSVEDNPPLKNWINGVTTEPPFEATPPAPWEEVPSIEQLASNPIATFHSPYLTFPHAHPLRLHEGFRGEYSLLYDQAPQLYFSSIDNRAHLLYAQEGVWNLGDGYVLRSHNLDGGPWINGWTRERVDESKAKISKDVTLALPGQIDESLYALNGFLICSASNTVVMKRLDQQPETSDVPLPTDKAHWRAFIDAAVPAGEEPRDPNDLMSWEDAFSGDSMRIEGGRISEMRATEDGFRFVLDLREGGQISGESLLDLSGLAPGRYVVTYDGAFSVTPLTPPAITGNLADVDALQLQPLYLTATVRNSGLRDVTGAELEVVMQSVGGASQVIAQRPITVLAESSVEEAIELVPWQSGVFTLYPSVILPNGRKFELEPMRLTIAPDQAVHPKAVLSATAGRVSIVAAGLGLLAFVAVAGAVGWQLWRVRPAQRRNDVA